MRKLLSIRFLLCFTTVFILFALGCYYFPRPAIGKAVPFLTFPISVIHPDFKIKTGIRGNNAFYLEADTNELKSEGSAKKSYTRRVELSHEIGTAFGIPMIFFPLIITWPGLPIRYRLKALLLVLPAMLLLIAIDVSLSLLIEIEMILLEPTLKNKIVFWMAQGLNCGGRQFLGIFLFAAAVAPHFLKKPVYVQGQEIERNSLCPCGSGKKFKNCCMS
jgi:hypothetical protein